MAEKDKDNKDVRKEFEEKLEKLDQTLDAGKIRKMYKARLVAKINNGEVNLISELKQLKKLEQSENPSPSPSPRSVGGEGIENDDDDIGVPESLRFRRSYTMSDAAFAARRRNTKKSTGPRSKEGKDKCKMNAWKHGVYAQNYIRHRIKPCLSSCSHYPCALIKEGATEPGGQCLDKSAVIQYYAAICDAAKNKKYDDFNEIAAITLAEQIHVVHTLMEDIQRDGTILKRFKHDKDGNELGFEVVPHPSLLSLAKLIDALNLTPAEMLITPLSLAKMKTDNKKAKALSALMSGFGFGESPGEEEEVERGKGEDDD